jgi:hypothetical protein
VSPTRTIALLAAGLLLGGCSTLVGRFSGRTEACAIIADGVPASARVQRLVDTGITINDDPVVEFVLAVQPGPGPGHEARARALVSRLDLPAVQPGRVFAIHYDPQQPERAAIDGWDCN